MGINTPWDSVPKLWKDEKAYLNWLRGQVRRIWSTHPVKTNYCNKRPSMHPDDAYHHAAELSDKVNYRTRKVRQCEMCHKWFPVSYLEVDHLHGGEGFSDYEGFLAWQNRMLFVGFDDIREICKDCHHSVTLCQRLGIEMHEVPREKARIEFEKMRASQQKSHLKMLKLKYGKNASERLAIYKEYLKEKFA